MDPRIVKQAERPPGQCLFSQDIDGPFIDLGIIAPWVRPHGYLSVSYVENLASDLLDMVPRKEVEERAGELEERVKGYAEEIDRLREVISASETLKAFTAPEEPERIGA